jgi:hypothetical protein
MREGKSSKVELGITKMDRFNSVICLRNYEDGYLETILPQAPQIAPANATKAVVNSVQKRPDAYEANEQTDEQPYFFN